MIRIIIGSKLKIDANKIVTTFPISSISGHISDWCNNNNDAIKASLKIPDEFCCCFLENDGITYDFIIGEIIDCVPANDNWWFKECITCEQINSQQLKLAETTLDLTSHGVYVIRY